MGLALLHLLTNASKFMAFLIWALFHLLWGFYMHVEICCFQEHLYLIFRSTIMLNPLYTHVLFVMRESFAQWKGGHQAMITNEKERWKKCPKPNHSQCC